MSAGGGGTRAAVDRWEQALIWYATLGGADDERLTNSLYAEWQEWYVDAENRRIFDSMSRLLSDRKFYRERRQPRESDLEEDQYDPSVSIAEWLRVRALHENRKRRSPVINRWWWSRGVALSVLAVFCLMLMLRRVSNGEPSSRAVYQTTIGGMENVELSDGSRIILGGRTVISVAYEARRRSVDLIQGQAWFMVAHNVQRPFVVSAGDGTITAVGTAFLVTRNTDRVVVAVTEGTVEVSAQRTTSRSPGLVQGADRPLLSPIRVSRGEELAFGDDGVLSPVRPADAHAAIGWTQGWLTFDDQSLRYVIETINRYSPRHIVVNAPADGLRFSGIVFENQIEEWLQSLEAIFPVVVEEHRTVVLIKMRPSTPHPQPHKAQP